QSREVGACAGAGVGRSGCRRAPTLSASSRLSPESTRSGSDHVHAGDTQFTRMRCGARSIASLRVIWRIAALEAGWGIRAACADLPARLEEWQAGPPPRAPLLAAT